jgi:hypothetical protein
VGRWSDSIQCAIKNVAVPKCSIAILNQRLKREFEQSNIITAAESDKVDT